MTNLQFEVFTSLSLCDRLVKSLLLRHSRVGGNDEKLAKSSFHDAISMCPASFRYHLNHPPSRPADC